MKIRAFSKQQQALKNGVETPDQATSSDESEEDESQEEETKTTTTKKRL